jgi:GUN4-like/Pentapeptide repeats (9 copies)
MNLVEFWERFDRGDRNFHGCVIQDIDFDYLTFDSVDFSNADLRDAKIRRTTFENCNFSGANLIGCNLDEVSINNSKLVGTKFNAGMMGELYVDRCDLSEAQFISADLGDVYFTKSNLSKSQWQQAHWCGGLTECNLSQATMDGLFASNVNIVNTIYPNGVSGELSWQDIRIEGEPPTPKASIVMHDRDSVEMKSSVGMDYTVLRNLLSECRWEAANEKTEELVRELIGEDSYYIDPNAIAKIPCIDLMTIDRLWVANSWGQFGFSIQKEIWLSIYGGYDLDPEKYKLFCSEAWGEVVKSNTLRDENSIKLAPKGDYPDIFRWPDFEEEKLSANLYRRLAECQLERLYKM